MEGVKAMWDRRCENGVLRCRSRGKGPAKQAPPSPITRPHAGLGLGALIICSESMSRFRPTDGRGFGDDGGGSEGGRGAVRVGSGHGSSAGTRNPLSACGPPIYRRSDAERLVVQGRGGEGGGGGGGEGDVGSEV